MDHDRHDASLAPPPPVVESWGLDPLYWACAKLPISLVHSCAGFPSFREVLCLHQHPIARIHIMGIISSIDRYNTNTSYTIDDGTGVISCVVWNRRRAEVTNLAGNATNGAPAALDAVAAVAAAGASAAAAGGGAAGNAPILPVARRAARAGNVFDAPVPAIGELGDLVSVRGKLSCYREQRQLVVTSMTPERAPDAESLWLLECAHLYRKIYSIPFDPAAILGAQSTQTSSTPAHSRAAATQLPVVPLLYGTAAKRPLQPHESQPAAKRWAPYHRNDHS